MNSDNAYYKAVTEHGYAMGIIDHDKWGPCEPRLSWTEPQWASCFDTEQECIDRLLDWQQQSVVPRDGVRRRPTLEEMPSVRIVRVEY
ncbi:MAG TPA: hypothetical protein VIG24_00495 [Acidimicrobiia bacterium]